MNKYADFIWLYFDFVYVYPNIKDWNDRVYALAFIKERNKCLSGTNDH